MTTCIFLRLDISQFALGADSLQWILYRASRMGILIDAPLVSRDWKAVSFVRSTKPILFRCMREKGCKSSAEAQTALDSYPDTFDAWKAANAHLKAVDSLEPALCQCA